MRFIIRALSGLALVVVLVVGGAIAFDSPKSPPPLPNLTAPFKTVDFSDLPTITRYTARDGASLAYREYKGDPDRLVVLIHGASGSSVGMHATAKALAASGAHVIAIDVRGHGQSGRPGDIRYIGELDDDLEDLLNTLDRTHHATQSTLIGFSSGGGFALRIAGGRLASRFNRVMLLAPFLRYDAPTSRSGGGSDAFVDVAIPRILGLQLLNRLGVTTLNFLPVVAFAVPPDNPQHLTATYSFRLLMNFQPDDDYIGDLRRAPDSLMAMIGANDEIFLADKLKQALDAGKPGVRVDIVPNAGHLSLTAAPEATAAIAKAWSNPF